ncbi:MAG: hypothetical protein AB1730_04650 [Myxococcota bacterium]|jgi:hypothetical protein
MTETRPRRSAGCAIALGVLACGGLVLLALIAPFAWSIVRMNLDRDAFAAFDHVPPGTSVATVVKDAEALGFERSPALGAHAADGGVESLVFERVVVPPFGRWFIHVEHVDGGVVSVRTSTLD